MHTLAASPDGLVHDPLVDPPDGIVEYKNPYNARNMTLTEAATNIKTFCLVFNQENQLELKKIMITIIKCSALCFVHSIHGMTLWLWPRLSISNG